MTQLFEFLAFYLTLGLSGSYGGVHVSSEDGGFVLHIIGISSLSRYVEAANVHISIVFVILVLKGSPVIQRAHQLYVRASGPKLPGVSNYHTSDSHSIFGSIAIIVKRLAIYDEIP
jgi:hypothetical protein